MSLLGIQGERETGMDVREGNSMAVQSIANVVKSSLGPQGLDKMLVDETGEVVITNDGATILKLLSIEHPAAKILGDLAQIQDKEVGDGTTSVVILAAELLKRATQLIKNKVHPTTVISGYRLALKEAIKHIKDDLVIKIDSKDTELLRRVAETSLSSKLIGPESKFFSEIVVNAITNVKTMVGNTPKYSVKNVNILKTHGKSVTESRLIDGYAIESTRGGMGMPLTIKNAKIALLDMNLAKFRMPPGVHVMVDDPNKLEDVRQREMDVTKERCRKIIEAGANVIVCSKGIDDLALKYFVEAKCIAIRRCDKADMKRLAAATGAKILITFESSEEGGEEIFNKDCLGEANEVSEEAVNDYNYRNPQSRDRAFFPYFFGKIKGAASVNIYNLYKKYKKI